jgi:hypothetical protein
MGGHPYQYVVAYADPATALRKLRQDVFQKGQYFGAHRTPKSPEEAVELAGATGTRSILDILRIADEPDYSCAAPLTAEQAMEYFGTERPSVDMIEHCDLLWEELERGMARYVVVYEADVATSLVFIGYSYD